MTTTDEITALQAAEDADLIARLQALDATLDPRDVANTTRALEAFHLRKQHIARTLSGLRNVDDDLRKPLVHQADAEARRPPVAAALAEVERRIEELPDYRTITDARERNKAWARHTDLIASRNALTKGVEFLGGVACVPTAVRELLGVVIEQDGRQVPNWYGCLSEIDERLATVGQKVASLRAKHDGHRRDAETMLAEQPVTA